MMNFDICIFKIKIGHFNGFLGIVIITIRRQECWQIKKKWKLWLIRTHFRLLSFNSILDYRETDEFLHQCILFLQNMILKRQHDSFHSKIDKFSVVFGSSLHEFQIYSLKNLLHHIKKWSYDPENTKELFFCFILGLNIC